MQEGSFLQYNVRIVDGSSRRLNDRPEWLKGPKYDVGSAAVHS